MLNVVNAPELRTKIYIKQRTRQSSVIFGDPQVNPCVKMTQ